MAIEPIKGFYVHDEATDTDGVAKYALSAVDGVDDIAEFEEETSTFAVDSVSWESGYKQANGTVSSSDSYVYSSIIPVLAGDYIEAWVVTSGGGTRQPLRFQCAYNGSTVVTSAGSNTQVYEYTVPNGIDGLSITCPSRYRNELEVRITRTTEYAEVKGLSELDAKVTTSETEIETLKQEFNDIATTVEIESSTIVDSVTWTDGYMAPNGNVVVQSGYCYSSVIPVTEGDIVSALAGGSGLDGTVQLLRFVTAFDGSTPVPTSGGNYSSGAQNYTVPQGIDGVVLTTTNLYIDTLRAVLTQMIEQAEVIGLSELETRVDTLESEIGLFDKSAFVSATASTMASGDMIMLDDARSEIKKSTRMVFECDGVPSTLYIGFSKVAINPTEANLTSCVKLDGTNLSYRYDTSDEFVDTPHGLTLSDNVQIIIEVGLPQRIHVTLISDGQMFQYAWNSQFPTKVTPCVIVDSGTVTNAKLTWTCYDFDKKVWLFGDSYMTMATDARWVYYLSTENEYNNYINNVLIDAHSGEGSASAFSSASNLLACATPKYILWGLGMNDGSDSQSAPSTNWATYRDRFITLCENNGVTPIFATIPTVPTVNNEKKNEWVRNSGYRFVDFAKAVGADGTGAWFSGMLSSDNVHPSAQGAKALFARVLLDLPEIMVD